MLCNLQINVDICKAAQNLIWNLKKEAEPGNKIGESTGLSSVCQYAKEQVLVYPTPTLKYHVWLRISCFNSLVRSFFYTPQAPGTWYHTIRPIPFCRRSRTSHQLPWVIRLSHQCLVWVWVMGYSMWTIQYSRLLIWYVLICGSPKPELSTSFFCNSKSVV